MDQPEPGSPGKLEQGLRVLMLPLRCRVVGIWGSGAGSWWRLHGGEMGGWGNPLMSSLASANLCIITSSEAKALSVGSSLCQTWLLCEHQDVVQ